MDIWSLPTLPGFVFGQMAFSLGVAFLPVFARTMESRGERAGWDYANNFLNSVALIGLLLCGALCWAAPSVVLAFIPWVKPAEMAMAVNVFRIAVVGGFLNCLFLLIGYIHNHQGRFAVVGAAGLLLQVCPMLGVLLFPGAGIYGVALGWLCGHALKLLMISHGFASRYQARLSWSCRGSRDTYRAAAPMLGGAVLGKSESPRGTCRDRNTGDGRDLQSRRRRQDRDLAGARRRPCRDRAFPTLGRAGGGRAGGAGGPGATRFVGQTFMLVMPLAAFMGLFRREIVRVLFQHGHFTAAMTEQVAVVVGCFSGFFVLSGIGSILSRILYAGRDRIPARSASPERASISPSRWCSPGCWVWPARHWRSRWSISSAFSASSCCCAAIMRSSRPSSSSARHWSMGAGRV